MVTRQLDITTPVLDPKTGHVRSHIDWACTIARKVRADRSFLAGSAEELLLESEAQYELVRKLPDFDYAKVPSGGDPDMAFRGWVRKFVACACEREAHRIRNGGTYPTTRTPYAVRVGGEVPEGTPAQEDLRRSSGVLMEFGDVKCRMYDGELSVESEPDLDTWARAVGALDLQRERTLWALGDLVLYGVERFGDSDATDMLKALGYATDSVRQARWVCRKFPAATRIATLSFGHHAAVSRLTLDEALALLRRAVRQKLTRQQLRDLVAPEKPTERPVLTRVDRERAPAVAARCGLTEGQVLEVLRLFREVKVG